MLRRAEQARALCVCPVRILITIAAVPAVIACNHGYHHLPVCAAALARVWYGVPMQRFLSKLREARQVLSWYRAIPENCRGVRNNQQGIYRAVECDA